MVSVPTVSLEGKQWIKHKTVSLIWIFGEAVGVVYGGSGAKTVAQVG